MNKTISMNEWLAALKDLDKPAAVPKGTFTVRMVQKALGCGEGKARGLVRDGIEAGLLEYAGEAMLPGMTGRPNASPIYRRKGKK